MVEHGSHRFDGRRGRVREAARQICEGLLDRMRGDDFLTTTDKLIDRERRAFILLEERVTLIFGRTRWEEKSLRQCHALRSRAPPPAHRALQATASIRPAVC